jgi:GH24 family phage-related lysozyme (muramidase)
MKTSQVGVNLIKSFEGLMLKAYKPVPTEYYWTIGYGHYGSDVKEGQRITASQAEEMLKHDLGKYEYSVNQNVKVKLNQNQFDALVSFCYNVGSEALRTSTLLKKVNVGDFKSASLEFDKWVHGGGKVLPGLVTRRKAEKALFLKECKPPTVYYTVKSGDTLSEIAQDKGTTVSKIKALNLNIKDISKIYVGQSIRIK